MKRNERTTFNAIRRNVTTDTLRVEVPSSFSVEARKAIHDLLNIEKKMVAVAYYWDPITDEDRVNYVPARTLLGGEGTRLDQEGRDIEDLEAELPHYYNTAWTGHRRSKEQALDTVHKLAAEIAKEYRETGTYNHEKERKMNAIANPYEIFRSFDENYIAVEDSIYYLRDSKDASENISEEIPEEDLQDAIAETISEAAQDEESTEAAEKAAEAVGEQKGYYKEAILKKFLDALREAREAVKSGSDLTLRVSDRNGKMGDVPSVSLLPFLTCPSRCKDSCGRICYAAKLANLRPSVLHSYAINTVLATLRPDLYWQQVRVQLALSRFFRFHVSGDILSRAYFDEMVSAALSAPHCEILVFTKRWEVVNAWIDENGDLPENLHLLFSGWDDLEPINPHGLPETNVFDRKAEPNPSWLLCGGNCATCGCRGLGCWQAKKGDVIAFKKH